MTHDHAAASHAGPGALQRISVPDGACDSAIHIYDAAAPVSPLAVHAGPAWATVDAYRDVQQRLGLTRTVVVQPTAYGLDNSVTLDAVAQLGRERTRAIVVIDSRVSEPELQAMAARGACGARFQMLQGGALPWDELLPVARRIAPLGWHIQLQMDGRALHEREALLASLPCPLVIDHVGKFLEPVEPNHPGFASLLRLLASGRCWLKLSGPYEVSRSGPPAYDDVGRLAKAAIDAAPERMVWGSNWPHVAAPNALPDDLALLDILGVWCPDATRRNAILVENPAKLYNLTNLY